MVCVQIVSTDPSGGWLTKAQLLERLKDLPPSHFAEVDAEWEAHLARKAASRSQGEEASDGTELTEEQKEERKVRGNDLARDGGGRCGGA